VIRAGACGYVTKNISGPEFDRGRGSSWRVGTPVFSRHLAGLCSRCLPTREHRDRPVDLLRPRARSADATRTRSPPPSSLGATPTRRSATELKISVEEPSRAHVSAVLRKLASSRTGYQTHQLGIGTPAPLALRRSQCPVGRIGLFQPSTCLLCVPTLRAEWLLRRARQYPPAGLFWKKSELARTRIVPQHQQGPRW